MYVYCIARHRATWYVMKKHPGKEPIYSVIATCNSEASAREILEALVKKEQPSAR